MAIRTGLWNDDFEQQCIQEYGSCNTANPCCDAYVGVIDLVNPCLRAVPADIDFFLHLPLITIILESPHIDEFDNNGVAIGPAQGATGKSIKLHLANLLANTNIPKVQYRLMLVEAVPYQCSNNCSPLKRKETNRLFKRMWREYDCRKNFEARIKSYNPDVILNACTGGIKAIQNQRWHTLNGLVHKSLMDFKNDNPRTYLCYSNHPAIESYFCEGIQV